MNNYFNEIEKLIKDEKKLFETQKLNYKNFIFDHVYISKLIDTVRSGLSNNDFYIIKKDKKFKIMHITNFNERFDGRLHYNTEKTK